jgi:drug/metabolite transporter (DMT)-like permease
MPETPNALRAALWMTGSIAAFTAMAIAARAVNHVHDSFEIMTIRSVVGFGLVLGIGGAMGQLGRISTARLSGHALRNLVHFTGQNLWFWSLGMIPLAQVFALEFTSPIWVILLAPLVLGEGLTRRKLMAAGLGFAGILVVARPDFTQLDPGVLAAAGSAVAFATTTLLTKRLTTGETVIGILFWLTLFQFGFGLVMAGYDGQITLPTAQTLPWLVLIGFCGVLAHFSLTSALTLAPASFVVPLDFVRLPLIAVIGALAYGEPLDPYVLLGGAVIFAGIWINLHGALKSRNRATGAKAVTRRH